MRNATCGYAIRPELAPRHNYASRIGDDRLGISGAGRDYYRQRVWLVAAAAFVSVVPYTLLVILPKNKELFDSSWGRSSKPARVLLVRWSYLHAVRTAVSLIAFVYLLYLTVRVQ
jgi:Domain of unknown function (DUF1772)